ncbi:MAG: hypothetical protein ACK5LC_12790 [Coprobacillaceae bacterium]
MSGFTCESVKNIVFELMKEKELEGKIYVAGGIVPWVVSGNDSKRKHSDVDLVVALEDMPIIREYVKKKGLYNKDFDSMYLEINKSNEDYGLEVFINDIPVNFAPFIIEDGNIVQKNFSIKQLVGYDALMKATMEGVNVKDYIIQGTVIQGDYIGMYPLEMVKAAKESSDREKDRMDILEIDKLGIDAERYERIKEAVHNMKLDVIPNMMG